MIRKMGIRQSRKHGQLFTCVNTLVPDAQGL